MRVVVPLIALLLAGCGGESSVGAVGPRWTAVDELAPWQQLDSPPLTARSGAAVGWTGEEIVVVGGSTFMCPPGADCVGPTDPPFRDGAALQPITREWRPIADAPVPVPADQPTAQLDGDVYVLVTPWTDPLRGTTLLRYRPASDTWTSYEVPPDASVGGLVAAGTGLVVYPGSDENGETPDLWFDPMTEAWSELPEDPLSPSFDRLYAWNDDGVHLFARDLTPSPGGASGPALANAAVLVDDAWRELPTGEALGLWGVISDDDRIVSPTLGCADGGEMDNYGRCIPYGAVLNTQTRTWEELPDAPSRGVTDVQSSGAFTADKVLLTSVGHPVLDLTTDTWSRMPVIDDTDDGATVDRTFAGAGPYGFAFGGARFEKDDPTGRLLVDAWLWTPTRDGSTG